MAWFLPLGPPLAGQVAGTVDLGASVVEYDGFLVSGAAVFAPAFRFDAANLSLGTQASLTIFESGNRIFQATAGAAWLTPPGKWWLIEFSGSIGASKYANQTAFGHVVGRTRLHVLSDRVGGWVAGTTGGSVGQTTSVPGVIAGGGWTVRDRFAFVGTATTTWLNDDGHLDLLGAARWLGDRVELEVRAAARPWAQSAGGVGEARSGIYGDVSANIVLDERISLAVSGGSYPSDPVRRVLAAKYVTVGLRLTIVGSESAPIPTVAGAVYRAARDDVLPDRDVAARLEVAPSGEPRTLRVFASQATSVELMGDFTDWRPVALTLVTPTLWEARLSVAPGVHRVNVRINGGAWFAPAGTRVEETEFGGVVGVLVVP